MPRVDFYLSDNTDPVMVLRTACRIIEKAYLQNHQLCVCCKDQTQLETLDKLLWTFHDTSFIPHVTEINASTTPAPIIICQNAMLKSLTKHDILINLTESILKETTQFHRIIEVVSAEETARKKARQRYRLYRDKGLELHSHEVP